MIGFNKMTPTEFLRFRERSVSDYAEDLMHGRGLNRDEALQEAEAEFGALLPEGPDTANQFLMTIADAESGAAVGLIWYGYEKAGGERRVFLTDFLIREERRRKGYATAALAEMERRAKADGCVSAALYVWEHNGPGAALYAKCGYSPAERGDGGVLMVKRL